MENLFTLTKTAASVKNIIIEFKLQDEPLLKLFVNTFNNSPYLNWQDVREWIKNSNFNHKDASGLRAYIEKELVPLVEEKAAPNSIQAFIGIGCDWDRSTVWAEENSERIKKELSKSNFIFDLDIDKEAEILLNDPDPEVQKAISFYPHDKKKAALQLITLFNSKKADIFNVWIANTSRYPAEFRFLLLLPIFDFSPNTKKTPTLDFWEEVVQTIFDSYTDNPEQSSKMLKVYKKTFDKVIKEKYHYVDFQKGVASGRWLFIPSKTKSDSSPEKYGTFEDNVSLLMHYGNLNGWCVGQEGTATNYLSSGDFFLYLDDSERARVAIRFSGKNIVELRGESNQDDRLIPYWRETVTLVKSQDWESTASNSSVYSTLESIYKISTLIESGGREEAVEEILKNLDLFTSLTREIKDATKDEIENRVAVKVLENPTEILYQEYSKRNQRDRFPPEEILIMPKVKAALMSMVNRSTPSDKIKIFYRYAESNPAWRNNDIPETLKEVKEAWKDNYMQSWMDLLLKHGQFLVTQAGEALYCPDALFKELKEKKLLDKCIDTYINENNPNMSTEGLERFWRNIPSKCKTQKRQKLINEIKNRQREKLWLNQMKITKGMYDPYLDESIPQDLLGEESIQQELIKIINNIGYLWEIEKHIRYEQLRTFNNYPNIKKVFTEKEIFLWCDVIKNAALRHTGRPASNAVVHSPVFAKTIVDVLSGKYGQEKQSIMSVDISNDSDIATWCNDPIFLKGINPAASNAVKKTIHGRMEEAPNKADALYQVKQALRSPVHTLLKLKPYLQSLLYKASMDFIEEELPNPQFAQYWAVSEYVPESILNNKQIRESILKSASEFLENASTGQTSLGEFGIDETIVKLFASVPEMTNDPRIQEYTTKLTMKKALFALKDTDDMLELATEIEPIFLNNPEYYNTILEKIATYIDYASEPYQLDSLKENETLNKILKQNPKLYGQYIVALRTFEEDYQAGLKYEEGRRQRRSQQDGFWETFATKTVDYLTNYSANLSGAIVNHVRFLDDCDDAVVDKIMKSRIKRPLLVNAVVEEINSMFYTTDISDSYSEKLFDRSREIRSAFTKNTERILKRISTTISENYYGYNYAETVIKDFLVNLPKKIINIPRIKKIAQKTLILFFRNYLEAYGVNLWNLEPELDRYIRGGDDREKEIYDTFNQIVLSDPEITKTISGRIQEHISTRNVFEIDELPDRFKTKKVRNQIKKKMLESLQYSVERFEDGRGIEGFMHNVDLSDPNSIPKFVKVDPKAQETLAKFISAQIMDGQLIAVSQLTKQILEDDRLRSYIVSGYKKILKDSLNPNTFMTSMGIVNHMRRKKRPRFVNKFVNDTLKTLIQNLPVGEKTQFISELGYGMANNAENRFFKGKGKEEFLGDEWQKAWYTYLISTPALFPRSPKSIQEYIMSDEERKEKYINALSNSLTFMQLSYFQTMPGILKHPKIHDKIQRELVPVLAEEIRTGYARFPSINISMLADFPDIANALVERLLNDHNYTLLISQWNNLPPLVKSDPRIQGIVRQFSETRAHNWYSIIKVASLIRN
jgi:hypothetical protein